MTSVHLQRAVEHWARGEYYDAHEVLEDFAEELEDDDDDWAIAIALVQIAASLHKHTEKVGEGAVVGKLEVALSTLDTAPDHWHGLTLGATRASVRSMYEALRRGASPDRLPTLRFGS